MSYLGLSEHIDFESLPSPGGRIRLDEVIGEGTYGEVFRAFDLEIGMFNICFVFFSILYIFFFFIFNGNLN
jgi:hypothetical protein